MQILSDMIHTVPAIKLTDRKMIQTTDLVLHFRPITENSSFGVNCLVVTVSGWKLLLSLLCLPFQGLFLFLSWLGQAVLKRLCPQDVQILVKVWDENYDLNKIAQILRKSKGLSWQIAKCLSRICHDLRSLESPQKITIIELHLQSAKRPKPLVH